MTRALPLKPTDTIFRKGSLCAPVSYTHLDVYKRQDQAYLSVERITHDQWWAGGILRSIHRYATDGMILTMLLHMLRHFAYDRYRGFRSFSWLTGVALLWMVYICLLYTSRCV